MRTKLTIGTKVKFDIAQGLDVGVAKIADARTDADDGHYYYKLDEIEGSPADMHREKDGELWVNDTEVIPLSPEKPSLPKFLADYIEQELEVKHQFEVGLQHYMREAFESYESQYGEDVGVLTDGERLEIAVGLLDKRALDEYAQRTSELEKSRN